MLFSDWGCGNPLEISNFRVEQMEGVDHLADERRNAQFDVNEMKIVWAGSRHAFEVSDRMSRLVANDPVSTLLHNRESDVRD